MKLVDTQANVVIAGFAQGASERASKKCSTRNDSVSKDYFTGITQIQLIA